MDKNEYNLKLEEIDKYVSQENYSEAAKVADTIDWRRVRNVRTLCMVSEVYEADNRYDDSKALLLRAYRRSPMGRSILYRLVEVTIQLKQYDEAIEYYSEYVQAAPHDTNRYILKYKIYKGRGSSLDEQIDILKEYLDQEYNEKYAYELAKLYQQADRIPECLAACDDLVLWFHSGKYVHKALELKRKYAPLTPKQQDIYEHRFDEEEEPEPVELGSEKQIVDTSEDTETEEIIADVQKEIADSLSEETPEDAVSEESESEEMPETDAQKVSSLVESTRDIHAEMVKSMREIVAGVGRRGEEPEEDEIAADEVIEKSKVEQFTPLKVEVPKQKPAEKAGRLSIDDILLSMGERGTEVKELAAKAAADAKEEAERTKERALKEEASKEEDPDRLYGEEFLSEDAQEDLREELEILAEETQRELESRAHRKSEEPDLTGEEELQEIVGEEEQTEEPAEDGGQEISDEEVPAGNEMKEIADEEIQAEEEPSKEEEPEEDFVKDYHIARKVSEPLTREESSPSEVISQASEAVEVEDLPQGSDAVEAEALSQGSEPVTAKTPSQGSRRAASETPSQGSKPVETVPSVEELAQEVKVIGTSQLEDISDKLMAEDDEAEEAQVVNQEKEEEDAQPIDLSPEELMSARTRRVPSDEIEEIKTARDKDWLKDEMEKERKKANKNSAYSGGPRLKEDQKDLFEGFVGIQNMEQQIAMAIAQAGNKGNDRTSRGGNILIFGGHGCGKTTIATNIAKAIAQDRGSQYVKMAKIYAADFNRKDVASTIAKIAGGILIIEEAGDLEDSVVDQLTTAMEFRTDGLIVILEDEQKYLHDLLMRHPRFTMKFTAQIYIPVFTSDELVNFGRIYAEEQDYVLSESATSALYSRISGASTQGEAVSITNVRELVDHAIARSNRFFRRLTAGKKRYDENDCIILQDKDFR